MSYSTPDIDTISQDVAAAIWSNLGRDAALPRSPLSVIAKALSGAVDGLYADIDAAAKDIIYDTASNAALIRWAGIWDEKLKAPSAAQGLVTFTGTATSVPAGTIVVRSDGMEYSLNADVALVGGIGIGTVTCLSAGAITTLTDGTILTVVQPAEGIAPSVTVTGIDLTPGYDIETPEELLVRLLARIRATPQGGSKADYEQWATSVSGITRAWAISPWNGSGTVGVLFMCDDRADPIPLAGDIANVQAAIDAVRPVGANSTAVAPTGMPLNFSIELEPTSSTLQSAVAAQLQNLIATECLPTGYTLPLTHIWAAVQAAIGTGTFIMPAPAGDVTTPVGSITTMGTISWLA
jgi:uncharacterized phage protein gp47/JayE